MILTFDWATVRSSLELGKSPCRDCWSWNKIFCLSSYEKASWESGNVLSDFLTDHFQLWLVSATSLTSQRIVVFFPWDKQEQYARAHLSQISVCTLKFHVTLSLLPLQQLLDLTLFLDRLSLLAESSLWALRFSWNTKVIWEGKKIYR